MVKKTKIDIINETVEHYSKNPRATGVHGGCYYFKPGEPDCMCAVGRCISKRSDTFKEMYEAAKVWKQGQKTPWTGDVNGLIFSKSPNRELDPLLKPVYRGHDTSFWKELQHLHDSDEYWNETGLTEKGRRSVSDLIVKYKNENTSTD